MGSWSRVRLGEEDKSSHSWVGAVDVPLRQSNYIFYQNIVKKKRKKERKKEKWLWFINLFIRNQS